MAAFIDKSLLVWPLRAWEIVTHGGNGGGGTVTFENERQAGVLVGFFFCVLSSSGSFHFMQNL